MVAMRSALSWTILLASVRAGIPPEYQANITVYHVNEATFGAAPVNMDTGNALGDMYFDFRSVSLPLECAHPTNATARDCDNAEVASDNLVITELILTVDKRFGDYGRCNVCVNGTDHHGHNNCTDGEYICGCGGYLFPTVCGAPVGIQNITQQVSVHDCGGLFQSNQWDCWKYNVAKKMGGLWYSTTEQGWCDSAHPSPNCTWFVAEAVKRVNKSCSDNLIYNAVEQADANKCFAGCGARNTSSPCWIECFYDTLLGPGTDKPAANVTGMPTTSLLAAWDASFASSGVAGCPAVPIPHMAHKVAAWTAVNPARG
eukprot:TRINITY_DN7647_c0_g1_i6.p1 TRINITY_DN7647_c0_g1~~TRINITY_DN7647_c0_g1_i6.p1  ORF type:complete len:315 (-),score=65.33 TRINITY_DN7647_c0_g1_i6:102-1046(-)